MIKFLRNLDVMFKVIFNICGNWFCDILLKILIFVWKIIILYNGLVLLYVFKRF